MPNWCYNKVTIGFDDDTETDLREKLNEDTELFMQFYPRPAEYDEGEKWYFWNTENWGTKWDASPYNIEWQDDRVTFNLETAWGPPVKFYEHMESLGYWVDAFYHEEGVAFVGHYQDGFDDFINYSQFSTADELEQNLPEWVEEEFGLISRKRDDEEEEWLDDEPQEESIYVPGTYDEDEKTGWFNVKVNPVYVGQYEVKTKEWPFPHVMDWNGKFWCMAETNSKAQSKVTEWRGLSTDPDERNEDLEKALEELKKEFDELMKA